ncbi:MAG: hypothetical protein Q4E05_09295, partial [Pseudoclavibacter sp.]|nr:hypothetical protein [Pseudoclavibacter sp.]
MTGWTALVVTTVAPLLATALVAVLLGFWVGRGSGRRAERERIAAAPAAPAPGPREDGAARPLAPSAPDAFAPYPDAPRAPEGPAEEAEPFPQAAFPGFSAPQTPQAFPTGPATFEPVPVEADGPAPVRAEPEESAPGEAEEAGPARFEPPRFGFEPDADEPGTAAPDTLGPDTTESGADEPGAFEAEAGEPSRPVVRRWPGLNAQAALHAGAPRAGAAGPLDAPPPFPQLSPAALGEPAPLDPERIGGGEERPEPAERPEHAEPAQAPA